MEEKKKTTKKWRQPQQSIGTNRDERFDRKIISRIQEAFSSDKDEKRDQVSKDTREEDLEERKARAEKLKELLDNVGAQTNVEPPESVTTKSVQHPDFSEVNKGPDIFEEPGVYPGESSSIGKELLSSIANVKSDAPRGDDHLNLDVEINAFSTFLASKQLNPPLAIGLFGDWGSGKSYFMNLIIEQIDVLSTKALEAQEKEETSFHPSIAQIEFNAWHYIDANLWASLITRIFDGLAEHVGGEEESDIEQRRREIIAKLKRIERLNEEALKKNIKANEEAKRVREILETLQIDRDISIENFVIESEKNPLATIVAKNILDEKARKALREIWGEEIEPSVQQVKELLEQIQESASVLQRLGIVDRKSQIRWKRVGSIIIFTCAITAAGYIAGQSLSLFNSAVNILSSAFASVGIWVGSMVASFSKYINKLQKSLNPNENEDLRKIELDHQERVNKLQIKVDTKTEEAEKAEKKYQSMERELKDLEREYNELDPNRMFIDFIEEKAASDKYRSRLGIISEIREDLEDLTNLYTDQNDIRNKYLIKPTLKKESKEPEQENSNQNEEESDENSNPQSEVPLIIESKVADIEEINRIILYIDDLDRCPPKRVAEVLQAVHLLLAFPLFVVVVAVDPRWLHRALEAHYPEFLSVTPTGQPNDQEVDKERATTPRAYLEKIFQIPYVIPQIEEEGFGNLVENMTKGESKKDKEKSVPSPDVKKKEIELNPKSREYREHEIQFMKGLYPLFKTPRSTKRLVNLYGLIRVTVPEDRFETFVDEDETQPRFKPTLLLLAITIGFPEEALPLMDNIKPSKTNLLWMKFIEGFKPIKLESGSVKDLIMKNKERDIGNIEYIEKRIKKYYWSPNLNRKLNNEEVKRWEELCDNLKEVNEILKFNPDLSIFDEGIIDRVKRYSFQVAVQTKY